MIGQFGLINSNKNDHSLPPTPRRQAADTVFLSSSSLSPFFIFKENSRPAEGAQLRRSLAARSAQQGAAGPRNPFLGKALAAGNITDTTQTPARVLEQGLPLQQRVSDAEAKGSCLDPKL